jgi:hypothetical protein
MVVLGIPPETWFPVVTLIIGAVLKAVFDMMTDRRTARREREARQDQRRDALRLKRVEFQRATLLELQKAISQLARFTGQAQHQDLLAYRGSGAGRKQLLTEEVNQGFLSAQTSVGRLRVRVRDQRVRQLAELLSTACTNVVLSTNEAASEHALRQVTSALTDLQEQIGAILRNLDDDEDRIASAWTSTWSTPPERHRFEALGFALPFRVIAGLAQVQKPGGAGGEARDGGGVGPIVKQSIDRHSPIGLYYFAWSYHAAADLICEQGLPATSPEVTAGNHENSVQQVARWWK